MMYDLGMDKTKARELYESGMSTRQVAKELNADPANVYRAVADIARPRYRPDTKHWRTCRIHARKAMEKYLGRKLNTAEHVHHINGDFTDNRIENLKVLSSSEHSRHHHDKGLGSVSDPKTYKLMDYRRHKSQRDAQVKAWRERNPDKFAAQRARQEVNRHQFPHVCVNCGIECRGLKKSKFCSKRCASELQHKRRRMDA